MDAGKMFENAIIHWRDKGGIGTAIIPPNLNGALMVLGILQRVYTRSPTCNTVIITNTFQDRINLIEYITTQECEENNNEFKELIKNKNIKIFTEQYVNTLNTPMNNFLTVVHNVENIGNGVFNMLQRSKFKLVVLNNVLKDNDEALRLYKVCPLLDDFKQAEIDSIRISSPVEETRIGVNIPEDTEDYKLLKYYTEYITTSINIFGSLDIMNQARIGNTALNISSNQICLQIAEENGWNVHLDMSMELNRQIDELYNPSQLKDRANQTYEIIRNRNKLLSDYKGKLEAILDIVNTNIDKKILIINKRADFATIVSDYLNNMMEYPLCGGYHDKLPDIPAIDVYNQPVYYKSGAKKGERKLMGSQAQKTRNEWLFNNNKLNILSTNSAPDKSLSVNVDIIIITSPQCEEIKSYLYRLANLGLKSQKLLLYTIYVANSTESKQVDSKPLSNNHIIIDNYIKNDNNSEKNDFLLA